MGSVVVVDGEWRVPSRSVDDAIVLQLHRRGGQRVAMWGNAVLYLVVPALLVGLAVSAWTVFNDDSFLKLVSIPLAVAGLYVLPKEARAARRAATAPQGTIELNSIAMVVNDPAIFTAPLVVPRTQIREVNPPPTGRSAFRVGGPVARANGALLSAIYETPNIIVGLRSPILMTAAQWNGKLFKGPLKSPRRGTAADVLWLRVDHPDGLAILQSWFAGPPTGVGSGRA